MSLGPFLRNPLTDFGASLVNHQHFDRCGKMEMNAMDCFEAYGMIRGKTKCADLLDDLFECRYKTKQWNRWIMIRTEQEKKLKEDPVKYANPPPPRSDI